MATLAEQFPAIYAEWSAAGGIESNLRAHLLGIGAIPTTAADIDFLLGQANAALAQLQNAQLKVSPPLPVIWQGIVVGQPRLG